MATTQTHLHHVVWCVEPESLGRVRELCEAGLGLDMEQLDLPDLGIQVLISWEAGIEIMAPTYAEGSLVPAAREFLATRGEGVFSVVLNCGDLDASTTSLRAQGVSELFADDIDADEVADRNLSPEDDAAMSVRQVLFREVCGMKICLQELSTETTN